jgi:hypothetical protein
MGFFLVEKFCKDSFLNLLFPYVKKFKTDYGSFKRTNCNSGGWFRGAGCNGLFDQRSRRISRVIDESKLGDYLCWSWLKHCWFNYFHYDSKRRLGSQ